MSSFNGHVGGTHSNTFKNDFNGHFFISQLLLIMHKSHRPVNPLALQPEFQEVHLCATITRSHESVYGCAFLSHIGAGFLRPFKAGLVNFRANLVLISTANCGVREPKVNDEACLKFLWSYFIFIPK
jgi:hypothetical protein